jgi:hypothetical protein
MPVATLTVKVGDGYDERGMEKAEAIFQQNGLYRNDPFRNGGAGGHVVDHGRCWHIFTG